MIPFYLINGFLGSGKTTFLKELFSQGALNKRIAVIQNEFAPSGIDGIELKHENSNFELVEINNGSVFCSCLMGSFIETLKKIVKDFQPEEIYLEASGLADPSTISQIMDEVELHQLIYLAGSICIVDAVNFDKALNKLPRVLQQIRIADTVCINKSDLVNDETIKSITLQLKKLNPFAQQFTSTFCKLPTKFFWRNHQTDKKPSLFFVNTEGSKRPDLKSTVLRTVKPIDSLKLDKLVAELNEISIRSKGFITLNNQQTVLFQSVFNKSTIVEYDNYPGNTELIVIGKEISLEQVKAIYDRYSA